MRLNTVLVIILGAWSLLSCKEIPFSSADRLSEDNLFCGFVRIDPDDKQAEKLQTRCWLWYDEQYLHVRFEAQIDSTFAKGTFYPKDGGYDGDFLRVQLITMPDAYYAYYYLATPQSNLYDGIRKEDMNVDNAWNSTYSYFSVNTDTLWTAVMQIPLKELRFQAKAPYSWKVILTRYNKKSKEFFSYPYANTKDGKDYFLRGQDIILNHQVKRSSNWKLKPYFVKGYDLMEKSSTYDPEHIGMDISFNPSQRTRLKVALNPDYSDTPPDNAQNVYNSKYPVYLSENRFFFTEDIDAFGVEYNLFYTRNITQPQAAVKFTGTSKGVNYGFLSALDKRMSSNGWVTNRDDYYQMVSLIPTWRKAKFTQSLLSRMNSNYYNHVSYSDMKYEFFSDVYVQSILIQSFRQGDLQITGDGDYSEGRLASLNLEAEPGNWNLDTKYSFIQKSFNADMGAIYETNYDDLNFDASWSSEHTERLVSKYGFNTWSSIGSTLNKEDNQTFLAIGPTLDDFANILKGRGQFSSATISGGGWVQFLSKYTISTNLNTSKTKEDGRIHSGDFLNLVFNDYHWENLSYSISYSRRHSYQYSLKEVFGGNDYYIYFNGNLFKQFDFTLDGTYYTYEYPCAVWMQVDTTQILQEQDREFIIASGTLNYKASNQITLKNGVSLDTYNTSNTKPGISFYSNLVYEFRPECYLYLGYKTKQALREDNSLISPGQYKRTSATAYLKVALTI